MSNKPTILLVPGAWHGPKSFAPLTSQLETAGYTVRGVSLPSVESDKKPLEDFQQDVDAIRSMIEKAVEAEEDVLLLMHIYGAALAGEAVKGLDKMSRGKKGKDGGVSHLFYCAAFAINKNQSLYSSTGNKPAPWTTSSQNDMIIECATPKEIFYGDLDEEIVERVVKALKPYSSKTFFSKTTWEPYREIPSTYLFCKQDKAVPYELQRMFVDGAKGMKWNTEIMNTSHSPRIP